jgi:hypothetical protein
VHRRQATADAAFTAHAVSRRIAREQPMLDVILLAVGVGFFALSIAYAYACERL